MQDIIAEQNGAMRAWRDGAGRGADWILGRHAPDYPLGRINSRGAQNGGGREGQGPYWERQQLPKHTIRIKKEKYLKNIYR